MRIRALNEWIITANNTLDWKVIFGEFDQDIFTLLPPLKGVSVDSVTLLI